MTFWLTSNVALAIPGPIIRLSQARTMTASKSNTQATQSSSVNVPDRRMLLISSIWSLNRCRAPFASRIMPRSTLTHRNEIRVRRIGRLHRAEGVFEEPADTGILERDNEILG